MNARGDGSGSRPPGVDALASEVNDHLVRDGGSPPIGLVRSASRRVIARHTTDPDAGASPGTDTDWVAAAIEELERMAPPRRVINATGVLLHTNLGRAPLDLAGITGGRSPSEGYGDIELDLRTGRRGRRFGGLEASLCALTGAEAALVVNNNAAAVLLSVSGLAAGREVIVSRGELVEIGGSFRVPEVITAGGARLTEVGTTNRTHRADYRGALGPDTAAVLAVHRSNFTVEGFVAGVSYRELAEVAEIGGVPLVVDLGGGLVDTRCGWIDAGPPKWLCDEPGVRQTLAAGADVVTFSGDKLLGGPQAGIIVGAREALDRLRGHPLARALRLDRLRAQVLQCTVDAYLAGDVTSSVPLWRSATAPLAELAERARAITESIHADGSADPGRLPLRVTVADMDGIVGAGAAPGSVIPGVGIEVAVDANRAVAGAGSAAMTVNELAGAMRVAPVPVVGVVGDGVLKIHLRTVEPEADARVVDALRGVANGP
ncbi:MAG: L-seryl-tRNA(Sec) selenium transferase [Microthrixaceae bacterium]